MTFLRTRPSLHIFYQAKEIYPHSRGLLVAIIAFLALLAFVSPTAYAATTIPFTVNMSEPVNVTGCPGNCPRIVLDVGGTGTPKYANYTSGSGTAALTFTYTAQEGDLDLDGITISSNTIDLNTSGTIKDLSGNNLSPASFTLPNTTGIKVDYPSLAMDFINNDYILGGLHYASLTTFLSNASGTFTRASAATYFDAAGTMQTATTNTPRFDHDPVTHVAKGLLIEEGRTNYVRNSTMQGAIIGVPGTLPTNWINAYNPGNFQYDVVGTGTENGMNYVDVRFHGNTLANEFQLGSDSTTASSPQDWTHTAYIRVVGGSLSNLSVFQRLTWSGSSGYISHVANNITANINGGTLYRASITATAPASTTTVFAIYNIIASATGTDVTLRIAAPQLEPGTFSTSFIPTSGTTGTRAADNFYVPTGSWYNQSEGLFFTETQSPLATTSINNASSIYTTTNGSPDAGVFLRYRTLANNFTQGMFVSVNTSTTIGDVGTVSSGINKTAQGIKTNDYALYANGSALDADNTCTLQTGITGLYLSGSQPNVLSARGITYYSKFKYYPFRASNTQLQLLTQ